MAECVSCGAVIGAGSDDIDLCESCLADDAATASDDSASFSWQAPTSSEQGEPDQADADAPATSITDHGAHWEGDHSESAAPVQVEEQQANGGCGLPIAAILAIIAGVGCLLLPAAGEQLIEAWGPAGFLIFLFAKPVGWILLAVGVFILFAALLRSLAATAKTDVAGRSDQEQSDKPKRTRSSAYPWLLAGIGLMVVLGYFFGPAANPPNAPEVPNMSPIVALGAVASWMMLLVGIVLFFGDFLESHDLFPTAAGDWGKILAACFVLMLITGSIFTAILLLGVLAFGLARWKSYSKTKQRE